MSCLAVPASPNWVRWHHDRVISTLRGPRTVPVVISLQRNRRFRTRSRRRSCEPGHSIICIRTFARPVAEMGKRSIENAGVVPVWLGLRPPTNARVASRRQGDPAGRGGYHAPLRVVPPVRRIRINPCEAGGARRRARLLRAAVHLRAQWLLQNGNSACAGILRESWPRQRGNQRPRRRAVHGVAARSGARIVIDRHAHELIRGARVRLLVHMCRVRDHARCEPRGTVQVGSRQRGRLTGLESGTLDPCARAKITTP